jgi:hypothetical protein
VKETRHKEVLYNSNYLKFPENETLARQTVDKDLTANRTQGVLGYGRKILKFVCSDGYP